MQRRGLTLAAATAVACLVSGVSTRDVGWAQDGGGDIDVGGGYGWVDTGIFVPGSPGTRDPIVQGPGGSTGGAPAVTCEYTIDGSPTTHEWDDRTPPGPGAWYFRNCSDGTSDVVWVPEGQAPADPAVPMVTPEQLALEARNRLVLPQPTLHRSPTETNSYEGDPFTWVNLWTWFWTDVGDFAPQTQTTSVGPVWATVVARPVGLLFDPGDGSAAVRCPGPGLAWTEADGNDAPPSGCGFQYRSVTDGTVTSRLGILWRVTWTGSGGTGGTLPTMETITGGPLRVLQAQVVNR